MHETPPKRSVSGSAPNRDRSRTNIDEDDRTPLEKLLDLKEQMDEGNVCE